MEEVEIIQGPTAELKTERSVIMCTCIAEIIASYSKVRQQTAEVARQRFDVDEYLDKVLVVKTELMKITDETNDLIELVRSHFTEFDIQETIELLAYSTPILILMYHLREKLSMSPLLPGLKTVVDLYRECMSDFQELCDDLQVCNIDIPSNPRCLKAERKVSEMMKGYNSTRKE